MINFTYALIGVRQISKKAFIKLFAIIGLIGTISLLTIYAFGVRDYYQRHQPKIVIEPPKYIYAIKGSQKIPMIAPSSVSVSGNLLIIASSSSGSVIVSDREGNLIRSFSVAVKALGDRESFPRAAVADDRGRIYVAAGGIEKLLVFDRLGRFRYVFPLRISPQTADSSPGQILRPTMINYINETLYVSDVGDQSIKVFSLTGRRLQKIGGPGTKNGLFAFPNAVTLSDDGRIYVSDSNNGRVQTFNPEGKYLATLRGPKNNRLSIPRGIAIDGLGRIHVVDMVQSKVFVFSQDHDFLFTYGGKNDEGALLYPNGIFIDRETGLIFIADQANNRVAVWAEE